MAGFTSFDDDVAQWEAAPDGELLPEAQQQRGLNWPTPAEQVSDHGAEGAPWQAAAGTINQPTVPPIGPLWRADHAGPSVPATSEHNQAAPATRPHGGHQRPQAYPTGRANIGQPFTVKVRRFMRHLATDQWDPTGKRVSPVDAPSAEVDIYGSQHYTVPRMIPYEVAPLFDWSWAAGDQFSANPGYLGVNADPPDMAPRPFGAVAAQLPDDPLVAQPVLQQPGAAAPVIDYDLGY